VPPMQNNTHIPRVQHVRHSLPNPTSSHSSIKNHPHVPSNLAQKLQLNGEVIIEPHTFRPKETLGLQGIFSINLFFNNFFLNDPLIGSHLLLAILMYKPTMETERNINFFHILSSRILRKL